MRESKFHQIILFVAGVIAIAIGGAVLFAPAAFFASNGIELGPEASLLNEIRPPGGALLLGGALMVAGAFVRRLRLMASVVAAGVYGAYGASRVFSLAVDGPPAEGLVVAMIAELALAAALVAALVRLRRA